MKLQPITRPIIFSVGFLVALAVYVLNVKTQILPIYTLYTAFPVAAALIGLYTSSIYGFNSANGRAILLITGGLVCWGMAETIGYVSDNFITAPTMDPQISDFFFLLAYPVFGAGVYQGFIAAEVKLKQTKKSLLAIVLSASLVLTVWVAYFGVYQAYDSTVDLLTNIVNIGYGVGDLIIVIASMLTILVAREYGGGKLARFWKTIALGFFMLLIGDILYFTMYWDQYSQDLKPYTYIDLLWIAAYLLLAYGMLENYLHISEVQNKIRLKLQQRQ